MKTNTPFINSFIHEIRQARKAESQYLKTGELKFLDNAIYILENILSHPDFETVDNNLQLVARNDSANMYLRRYWTSSNLTDLDRALSYWEKLVSDIPENSPFLPDILSNLGIGQTDRYNQTSEPGFLDASVKSLQRAVSLLPDNAPGLPSILNNLGNGLKTRYEHSGNIQDLTEAVQAYRKSVQQTLDESPELSFRLNNLGVSLRDRYIRTGKLRDMKEAIRVFRQAAELMPAYSPLLPSILTNLGTGLRDSFARTGDISDLNESLEAFQKTVDLTPENIPNLPMYLSNLGSGLRDRYIHTENSADLEEAINAYQKAVNLMPEHNPGFPRLLSNLGISLHDRYSETGEFSYLENAIDAFNRAVKHTPGDSPYLASRLNNTGAGLKDRYIRTGAHTDLTNAVIIFRKAAQMGLDTAAEDGLRSARNWIDWAFSRSAWAEVEEAYGYFTQAVDRLLQNQDERREKEIWLKEFQGIAAQAAYSLAQKGQAEEAVLVLENGLARLFSEAMKQDQPGISLRFKDIQETSKIIPLVYLACTDAGGMALIVREKVEVVRLPELTKTGLRDALAKTENHRRGGYTGAYFNWFESPGNQEHRNTWLESLENTTHWLWKAVIGPLTDVFPLDTKITLIPVGRLGLLPLHAAWTEDKTAVSGRRYALDHLTIAYAPSTLMLIHALNIAKNVVPDSLLAVDNPRTVKAKDLPYSEYEVQAAVSLFEPGKCHVLRHEQATREAVLKIVRNHTVFHFSCHGIADYLEPLNNCLVMAGDERMTLKDLLELHLDGVRLAMLSACETGIAGIKLPDEAISLASGWLQAGVAGVVASLWTVNEISTMMLMTYFYYLWRSRGVGYVEALRQAQIWVRDSTNKEKLEYFKELERARPGDMKITREALKRILKAIGFSNPEARGFAHPYYWAAFQYTGV